VHLEGQNFFDSHRCDQPVCPFGENLGILDTFVFQKRKLLDTLSPSAQPDWLDNVNKIKTIATLALLILICTSHSEAVEFSLKLGGGLSFIKPGEVNRVLEDWEQWQILNAENTKTWTYLDGTVSGLKTAWDLEIEVLFILTSRLAVGLASGYMYGSLSEQSTSLIIEKVLGVFEVGKPTKMTGVPLVLSAYYFQPLTSSLRGYVRAGAGYLWATYVERESNREVETEKYGYPQFIQASARDTTALLALGLLYETEPGIRFFVEGSWRWAKATGFEGDDKTGTTGTLFFVEAYDPDLDFWQEKYVISPDEPSGEYYRSVKEVDVDFGGLSVKIGIMIRF